MHPEQRSFDVLYQDEWILAVNKRSYIPVAPSAPPASLPEPAESIWSAGSPIQGSTRENHRENLLEQVQQWLAEQSRIREIPYLGLVHRIDQPVTGVVLFARNPATLEGLNQQFRERKVRKLYWAVTEAPPPEEAATLEHYLLFDPKRNRSRIVHPFSPSSPGTEGRRGRAKKSLLQYRLAGRSDRYFFLEIELITGRPHQIRAQLSAIGCPVKGDLKYGARRSNPGGGILLHARSVGLTHPETGVPLTLTAEPPSSTLWGLFPRND